MLWPEAQPEGHRGSISHPRHCTDKKPDGDSRIGIGLPVIVPLDKDPRDDRFLMDQLIDTGARTTLGLEAS